MKSPLLMLAAAALWILSLGVTWKLARSGPETTVVTERITIADREPAAPELLEGPRQRLTSRIRERAEAARDRERRFGDDRPQGNPVDDMLRAYDSVSKPDQQRHLNLLADRLGEVDIGDALEQLDEMPAGPFKTRFETAVLRRWSQLNPLAALDFTGEIKEPKRRHDLRQAVFRSWAEVEPMQALVYAELNPTGNMPSGRFGAIFEGVRRGEPDNALAFFEQVDLKKYSGQITGAVFEMFNDHPNRMIEWTENLQSGRLKDLAYHRTLDHWARYDPLAAKEWMERTVEKHYILPANIELGESWARVDPQAAADWAMDLPKDQQHARIVDRVFYRWVQYDRPNALEWLGEQKPSRLLDGAIQTQVRRTLHRDPAGTIAWAETISNDKERARTVEQVAYSWMRRDPDAMADYVKDSRDLETAQKERLLKMYEKTMREREQRAAKDMRKS